MKWSPEQCTAFCEQMMDDDDGLAAVMLILVQDTGAGTRVRVAGSSVPELDERTVTERVIAAMTHRLEGQGPESAAAAPDVANITIQ